MGASAGGVVGNTQDLARFWRVLFSGELIGKRGLRLMEESVPGDPGSNGVRNYFTLGLARQDVAAGAFWPGSPELRIYMKLGDIWGYTSAAYYIEGPAPYGGVVVTNTTNLFPSPVGDLGVLRDASGDRRRLSPESVAQREHVAAAAAEHFGAEPAVEPGAADDVGHERVTGDELAAGQSNRERLEVDFVARPRDPLRVTRRRTGAAVAPPFAPPPPACPGGGARQSSCNSSSRPRSGRASDSRRCAADSGTTTAPLATASRSTGSSSRKPGFRFAIPLR